MATKKDETTSKTNSKPYGKVLLTLRNQLLPEDKLLNTPSQQDGLSTDTEMDLRIYGCEMIQTAGILLRLPQVAMATGQVLLQRFYYSKSLVRHPVEHVAMACVCLASKIEEAPRGVRDVINVFHHVKQVSLNKQIQPMILDANYVHLKNLVIKAERRVLKELGFSVHIKHPHKIIVMYLQVLNLHNHKKLMQYSWNYMNDALRTDVFVRYQPETVACACIYLTARKLRLPLPRNPNWFSIFGASETDIRDICVKILRLYGRPKPDAESLEKKVDELCKKYQEQRAKQRASTSNTNNTSTDTTNQKNENSDASTRGAGAHNAWGGFISRSGSHLPPAGNSNNAERDRRSSKSRSPTPSGHDRKHRHRSRRTTQKRTGRSRSRSPRQQRRRSRSNGASPQQHARNKRRRRSGSQQRRDDREERRERHREREERHRDDKRERSGKDKERSKDRRR